MRASASLWQCGRFQVSLSRPIVMGILNVTPDSFSDGGLHVQAHAAIAHAEHLILDGADIIDIGAESSRPGAHPLSVEEEWARLAPVLEPVVAFGKPVSVDTVKPEIMRRALAHGAAIINDIQAFRSPGAVEAVASSDCGLCLMHMQGEPRTMQANPEYGDVVHEVRSFLFERAHILEQAGVERERLCLDPGFGFGKRPEHNLALLQATARLVQEGYPWLIGVSRKSMIAHYTGKPQSAPAERVPGSVAAALYAVEQGAHIVRVHDVRETVEALKIWQVLANR